MGEALALARSADAGSMIRAQLAGAPAAILVQASSRSWAGAANLCMRKLDGKPIFLHTLERLRNLFPRAVIRVVAPEFDRGGLDFAANAIGDCEVQYSFDDNPLQRMIAAVRELADDAIVLRLDGLHCFFHEAVIVGLLDTIEEEALDFVKSPDDFPPTLTGEAWRAGGLRRFAAMLAQWPKDRAAPHCVHPKFLAMRKESGLRVRMVTPPAIADEYLTQARRRLTPALDHDFLEVTRKLIPAGDQLSFHYVLASRHLKPTDRVLDIASGQGYGGNIMAQTARYVTCADLDTAKLEAGRTLFPRDNLGFSAQDVMAMRFPDGVFDVVVSMETIEHMEDVDGYLCELKRVLAPGGLAILSTPQNSLGHIPLTPAHLREFSLDALKACCGCHFTIEKIVGLKAGTIYFDDDPVGSNTMMFLRKRER